MSCDNQCLAVAVPGPPGTPATNGNAGTDGISAYATILDAWTMPDYLDITPPLEVDPSSAWAFLGQTVQVEGAGWMSIWDRPDLTHIVLQNLADPANHTYDYPLNSAPGTAIPINQIITPSGPQGPQGLANTDVLIGYGILGRITGLNLNSANTDTAFSIASGRYLIDKVIIESPSAAVTTATLGLFTAAGGGGVSLCANQALAGALTATTKIMNLVKQAIVDTDERTNTVLYARVGTAEGAARTANLQLMGWVFDS